MGNLVTKLVRSSNTKRKLDNSILIIIRFSYQMKHWTIAWNSEYLSFIIQSNTCIELFFCQTESPDDNPLKKFHTRELTSFAEQLIQEIPKQEHMSFPASSESHRQVSIVQLQTLPHLD